MKKMATFFLLLLIGASLAAQRNCGSMEHLHEQIQQSPEMRQRRADSEERIQKLLAEPRAKTVITIPVVFHIIHNGDAVGVDENLSDALISAQLAQMNADFSLSNADVSSIPMAFLPLAANTSIQFCLAASTPDCQPTNGINRVNGGQATWTRSQIQNTLKPNTIWDRDEYLNIWTVVFNASENGLLGYAQFPGGPAATDGVVVTYTSVGSLALPNPDGGDYDSGRTMTHEIGHWLNLYHIWGDDENDANTCAGSDLVSDTPNQAVASGGCPNFPQVSCANGPNGDMFMNYMDYSDDDCLNMFSVGQGDRMYVVLDGGDRSTLANSPGCLPPGICYCDAASNDLAANEKIGNIVFSDIAQASSSNSGYENFTNVVGQVAANQTYLFTATISNGFSTDQVLVWIDFNQNGSFDDAGEQVFTSSIGSGPHTANIAIPATATLGQTRMRIRLHDTSDGPNSASCGNSTYGQVEDYTLDITAALPVSYRFFDVKKQNDHDALLVWETEYELDNKGFGIELATDTQLGNFKSVGFAPAQSSPAYSHLLSNLPKGQLYFRLRQEDFDGSFSYSSIRSLRIDEAAASLFSISPNPATDVLHLSLLPQLATDNAHVQIYNQMGQCVKTIPFGTALLTMEIPLHGLAAGSYYVRLAIDGVIEIQRLVIVE